MQEQQMQTAKIPVVPVYEERVQAKVQSLEKKLERVLTLIGDLNVNPLSPLGGMPGPGEADTIAYNSRNHSYIAELHEKYGDIFTMRIGGSMARAELDAPTKTVVFVRDPDAIRDVLVGSSFAKTWDAGGDLSTSTVDYVHNLIQPMLTNSVFNEQGTSDIPAGRLALRPVFISEAHFVEGFARELDHAIAKWTIGPRTDVLAGAHDLIRQALFVVIAGGAAEVLHEKAVPVFHKAMAYFVGRYAPAAHKAEVTAEDEAVMDTMLQAGLEIVQGWRQHFASLAPAGRTESEENTMLRVMDKKGYDDAAMAAMLVNTLIAGAEAPGSALAQLLQELAFNQSVQQLLRDEVAKTGGCGAQKQPVAKDMRLHRKVHAAVLEGLRAFAPATLVQRVAVEDTELAGYPIPAGTVVGLCVSAVHGHDKVHANPAAFDLERGSRLSVSVLKSSECFMTFSGGSRGCPGKHLGIAMLRIALAKLVHRFEFKPTAGGRRATGHSIPKFVEWQIGGIPLDVTARPQQAAPSRVFLRAQL